MSRRAESRRAVRAASAVAVCIGVVAACARQIPPPGGQEDQRPPVVISTFPNALDTLEDLTASVRFDFDERISERASGGQLDGAISVSPRVGDVKVKHGRSSLSLEVEDGFQAGIVYRVTLQPIVMDLFGNTLTDAFELVFSTGGDPVPTTLAGQVWDRTSGQGVDAAIVLAVDTDGLTHESVTDREGIFAFRYLSAGSLQITAFDDVNRDGEVDSTEVQGAIMASVAVGDTLLIDVAVLEPDTSAAVVVSASPLDSITIFVEFDDLLDSEASIDVADMGISREDGAAPSIVRLFYEADYAAYVDAVSDSFARLDSIDAASAAAEAAAEAALAAARADSLAAADSATLPDSVSATLDSASTLPDSASTTPDSASTTPDSIPATSDSIRVGEEEPPTPEPVLEAPEDTVVVSPNDPRSGTGAGAGQQAQNARTSRVPPTRLDPLPGPRPGPTADERRVLPGRRVVAKLSEPLVLDVEYEVELSSMVNINGLAGGGGIATLVRESPPPPDTLALQDSLETDSLAVPDTGVVDTLRARDAGSGLRR